MRHKKGFYEVAPVAGFIARQDWTHTMERAERNGLSLQSRKGSTGLLFSVRILAPILDGGLRHIVLAAIQYSLGRHTYMPGIVAEFTCRNLSRLDEATRFTAVAEIRAHLKPIWRTGAISSIVAQLESGAHIWQNQRRR